MLLSTHADNARPFLTWQRITDWAQEHYRSRTFSKDERIPSRAGLLYLVERGAVRLVGTASWPAMPAIWNPIPTKNLWVAWP